MINKHRGSEHGTTNLSSRVALINGASGTEEKDAFLHILYWKELWTKWCPILRDNLAIWTFPVFFLGGVRMEKFRSRKKNLQSSTFDWGWTWEGRWGCGSKAIWAMSKWRGFSQTERGFPKLHCHWKAFLREIFLEQCTRNPLLNWQQTQCVVVKACVQCAHNWFNFKLVHQTCTSPQRLCILMYYQLFLFSNAESCFLIFFSLNIAWNQYDQ